MRYIRLNEIEGKIEATWRTRASKAIEKIRNTSKEKRASFLNRQQKIWKDFKQLLREVSHEKCWYCETIEKRTNNAVDHYRPKNRVMEAADPDHSGYWWLAFDWRNYRFSCSYCNSPNKSPEGTLGKHDHFPLLDEKKRAKTPDDPLEDEQPLLLDPTNLADVSEISFDPDGRAVPARTEKDDPIQYERAYRTIEIYHLNHPRIVEHRADLMRRIVNYLDEADKFFIKRGSNAYAHLGFKGKLEQIYEALQPPAEYSAAARTAVGSARGNSPSADDLFRLAHL